MLEDKRSSLCDAEVQLMINEMYDTSRQNAATAEDIRNPDGNTKEYTDRELMFYK